MRSITLTLALAGLFLAGTASALAQGQNTNLATTTDVTAVVDQSTAVPVRWYGYGSGWYGYYGPRYYTYRPYYYGATPYYDYAPVAPYTGYYGGYYYPYGYRYGYRSWGPGPYYRY